GFSKKSGSPPKAIRRRYAGAHRGRPGPLRIAGRACPPRYGPRPPAYRGPIGSAGNPTSSTNDSPSSPLPPLTVTTAPIPTCPAPSPPHPAGAGSAVAAGPVPPGRVGGGHRQEGAGEGRGVGPGGGPFEDGGGGRPVAEEAMGRTESRQAVPLLIGLDPRQARL